ncbi:MAG: glycerophosphodiester phosphodiesterase family protein [Acutalibacteraceae bacterium]|nr:glycerophosphodiester phosphodiesterase family protein [Acutalibacteraceae bacterium]
MKRNKKSSQKGFRKLKITFLIIAIIIVYVIAIPVSACKNLPGKEAKAENITNPYITEGNALVSAHRSGKDIAPENTMAAFINCIESEDFNVDIYEFDLHITKDGKLILLHDSTLDRTTNSAEHFGKEGVKPSEKTYAELRELNFGENFENADGEYPYRGLRGDDIPDELRAVLLEDVLDYLEGNGHFQYIIEIKDAGENGKKACDELYRILKGKDLLEDVVFGTFNPDVTSYADKNYPDMLRSASIPEVLAFYLLASYGIDVDSDFFKYEALQIPSERFGVVYLNTYRIINYAHRHNIAVQYWTINDAEEVEYLNSIGADCIMSDSPDMAYDVINS